MPIIVWGIVVFLLVVVFMLLFKEPISKTIRRAKRFGIWKIGVDFDPEQTQSQALAKSPTNAAEDLTRGMDNDLVLEFEPEIDRMLEGHSPAEQIKILKRNYAWTLFAYYFIDLYRRIFGSQIRTLEFINQNGVVPRESVRPFYNSAASQYSIVYDSYSFDQWLGFLESEFLIKSESGNLAITIRGREFLSYLVKAALSKETIG